MNEHTIATPEQCERVHITLRAHPEGATVTNIAYWSGVSRPFVIDALLQMEQRGAVSHCGTGAARWFAKAAS